jgi:hypothetical protein
VSPRFFRPRFFTWLLFFVAIVTLISATRGADRLDSFSPPEVTVKRSLLQKINVFSHEKVPFQDGQMILYQRYPLSGRYPATAFDMAAKKIEALLSRHGIVHDITARKLGDCLLEGVDSCSGFRYLVTPCEINTIAHEKKVAVGSFVKLNQEGDFIPANATRIINSRTTEVTVRFVMVDLNDRTIVFDDREKTTVSDDEAVRGTAPMGEKSSMPVKDQVKTGILRVVAKIEAKIKAKI